MLEENVQGTGQQGGDPPAGQDNTADAGKREKELSRREAELSRREAELSQKEETERLYNAAHYELCKKGIPEEFADVIDRSSEEAIQTAVHRLEDLLLDMKLIRYAVEGNSKLRVLEELGDDLEGDGGLQMRRVFAQDGGRIRKNNRTLRKIFGLKGR